MSGVGARTTITFAVHPCTDTPAASDATGEVGVLGTDTRAEAVEDLSEWMRQGHVDPFAWYGLWLFVDWLDFALEGTGAAAVVASNGATSTRDPNRQLSRLFHRVGRATGGRPGAV